MTGGRQLIRERPRLVLLICLHIVVCCISLACVAYLKPVYHLLFNPTRLLAATATVAAFSLVGLRFAYAEFSVGYFVGFHFFTMVAGYLWINGSSAHFTGVPFGGMKLSGVGREESLDELLSYTQLKTLNIMLG